jgi:hypothetical protein
MMMTGCRSSETNEAKETNKTNETNNNGEEVSKNELVKGRYIEEDVEIPSEVNSIISLVRNPEGVVELYATSNEMYVKYMYINNEWNKEDSFTVPSNIDMKSAQINKMFYGQNERLYMLVDLYPSYENELYQLSSSGEFDKIDINKFKEKYKDEGTGLVFPYRALSIEVLKNGMIAIMYDFWDGVCLPVTDSQLLANLVVDDTMQ